MRITRYTDYSLRVLMYVALVPEGRLSTIREVAEAYDISRNHLMKVVNELTALGYLQAQRGKNGGIRLNRPAEEINVGELVRHMEASLALVECFGSDNHCTITPLCQLKHALANAMEAFFSTLDDYTLADLLPRRSQGKLQQTLGILGVEELAD